MRHDLDCEEMVSEKYEITSSDELLHLFHCILFPFAEICDIFTISISYFDHNRIGGPLSRCIMGKDHISPFSTGPGEKELHPTPLRDPLHRGLGTHSRYSVNCLVGSWDWGLNLTPCIVEILLVKCSYLSAETIHLQ